MIDSIKFSTNREFILRGQPESADPVGPRSDGVSRNLTANLDALLYRHGLSGDWIPSANISGQWELGRHLRLKLKHRYLGVALFGTATHLDGFNLTLPKLWSGSADNRYIIKNDAELNEIRKAVYNLLDQITHPPSTGAEHVRVIHLCYQVDRTFVDAEKLYKYARTSLVKKPTSVTPGEEILFRGKLVELAIYRKKGSDGFGPIRFEARFKDKDKIREYFGLGEGEHLDFRNLTIDGMLKAFHKIASTLRYPILPERKKKSGWTVYHTLEAVDSTGWTHPKATGDDEGWMSERDIVDIHTGLQCDDSKTSTREAVAAISEARAKKRNPELYESLRLSDLLPQSASEWEQRLNANESDWSKIRFVGLELLWEMWFPPNVETRDVAPPDNQPGVQHLLPQVLPPLEIGKIREFGDFTPIFFHNLVVKLRSQKDGSLLNPFPFVTASIEDSQPPFNATLEAVAFHYITGSHVSVHLPMSEHQSMATHMSGLGFISQSDALKKRDDLYTGPLATFWASDSQNESQERQFVLIHLNDFRAYSETSKFQRVWQFQPLSSDNSVSPEAREKWHTLEEMKSLIFSTQQRAFAT